MSAASLSALPPLGCVAAKDAPPALGQKGRWKHPRPTAALGGASRQRRLQLSGSATAEGRVECGSVSASLQPSAANGVRTRLLLLLTAPATRKAARMQDPSAGA
jgi:hypothetical protein